jgi:hypothetical protein
LSESLRWIYLTSLPVSGSTVISLVANAHPDLVSPGELFGPGDMDMEAYPEGPTCSCTKLVGECPFWSEVARRHRARGYAWRPTNWGLGYHFDDHPNLGRLALSRPDPRGIRLEVFQRLPYFRPRLMALHARNKSYARAVLEVSGKKVLLDASKQPQRIVHLAHIPGVDLRVVHLIRHPGGFVYSLRRSREVPVAESARTWAERNVEIERLVSGMPKNKVLRVRHEDFCTDPQGVMDNIFKLADLPSIPIPDNLRDIKHHLLGNPMRTRGDTKITRNDAFERELTPDETSTYKSIAGSVARRYGYSV